MEQHMPTSAVESHDQHGAKAEIKRVTIILTILTIIELILGYSMVGMSEESLKRHIIKGIILILMVAKAFYIVGYFMHLKHEIRNLVMTVVTPLLLFVWFIIAFLYDGHEFNNLRNTYNSYYRQRGIEKVEKPAENPAEKDRPAKAE